MKQFKKLNKLFTRFLEPTLLENKVKLCKEDFFQYIAETNPKPTMTRFVEIYTPCIENTLHWLHRRHFIDKNNTDMVDRIYSSLEKFLEEYHTNSIEIQKQFKATEIKQSNSWFQNILNK
tara:strand:+ start:1298 stop:1657 length:360 start_codon:yes stop_codon:yes gene_type:complete